MHTSDSKEWFEPLPSQCPPQDALPPNGIFYRLANATTPVCEDFWSHRKLYPAATYNTDECTARSVSIFTDKSSLSDLLKLPRHQGKAIVAVKLQGETAGRLKKTFRDPHHFSWWRPADFPVLDHMTVAAK